MIWLLLEWLACSSVVLTKTILYQGGTLFSTFQVSTQVQEFSPFPRRDKCGKHTCSFSVTYPIHPLTPLSKGQISLVKGEKNLGLLASDPREVLTQICCLHHGKLLGQPPSPTPQKEPCVVQHGWTGKKVWHQGRNVDTIFQQLAMNCHLSSGLKVSSRLAGEEGSYTVSPSLQSQHAGICKYFRGSLYPGVGGRGCFLLKLCCFNSVFPSHSPISTKNRCSG